MSATAVKAMLMVFPLLKSGASSALYIWDPQTEMISHSLWEMHRRIGPYLHKCLQQRLHSLKPTFFSQRSWRGRRVCKYNRLKKSSKYYPVFSDIHAMFRGCVYGQEATISAAKYLWRFSDVARLPRLTHLTPLLVPLGRNLKSIQPTVNHAASFDMSHDLPIKRRLNIPPKAPWNPRSRTLSEWRTKSTMMIHCITYGGAVNALAIKTLKLKDLMTVGRSRNQWIVSVAIRICWKGTYMFQGD